MITICADSPIPSFDSIFNKIDFSFPPNFDFNLPAFPPSTSLNLPALPSLPSPIYPDISHLSLELCQIAQEIQSFQLLSTLTNMINPLLSFAGGLMPTIPLIGLSLTDLISCNPTALYDSIRKAILQFQFPDIDFTLPDFTLPTFSLPNISMPSFPTLPIPMFGSLSIPSVELVNTVKLILKDYMNVVTGVITGLINKATSILQIASFPGIPAFPSMTEIMGQISELVKWPGFDINLPTFPSLDFLTGFSLNDLFGGLSFPSFPSISLPDPLIPNYSNFELEFMEGLNIMFQTLITTPMNLIINFLNGPLSIIGFSFPTLCVSL